MMFGCFGLAAVAALVVVCGGLMSSKHETPPSVTQQEPRQQTMNLERSRLTPPLPRHSDYDGRVRRVPPAGARDPFAEENSSQPITPLTPGENPRPDDDQQSQNPGKAVNRAPTEKREGEAKSDVPPPRPDLQEKPPAERQEKSKAQGRRGKVPPPTEKLPLTDEQKAHGSLGLAKILITDTEKAREALQADEAARLLGLAKKRLTDIRKTYPNTKAAEEARKILATLE
jgi:hypothetical protein